MNVRIEHYRAADTGLFVTEIDGEPAYQTDDRIAARIVYGYLCGLDDGSLNSIRDAAYRKRDERIMAEIAAGVNGVDREKTDPR